MASQVSSTTSIRRSAGVLDQGVQHRPARLRAQAEHGGDRERHQPRVGHRGDVDEPDAVRVRLDDAAGHLDRQPGLARAARPDHGDQPVLSHQQAQLDALGLPADERGHLGRQVVRDRVGGAGPGELPLQARRDELEQPFPVVEAAQPVQAQVEQGRTGRQRLGPTGRRRRAEHLTTVRGGGDPGGPVHLGAGVLPVARFGVSRCAGPSAPVGAASAVGQSWLASARWAVRQAVSAAAASAKATKNESPSVNSSAPPVRPACRAATADAQPSTGR